MAFKMRKALWAVALAIVLAIPVAVYAATSIPRQSPTGSGGSSAATGAWTNLAPAVAPPNGLYGAIAYDSKADRVIFFPGNFTGPGTVNSTWAYDLTTNTWANLKPIVVPPVKERSAMVYDSKADRIILYGGNIPPVTNQTWAYDSNSNTWTDLHPRNAPPARAQHSMAYDEQADRVVLFGGSPGTVCCGSLTDETWVYDFSNNTWTEMHPQVSPPARDAAAMTYDSERGLVVLFGGQTEFGNHFANDTWTYNLSTDVWTNVTRAQTPPPLYAPGMAYDAAADRVILFGGELETAGYSNQTWIYDSGATTWARIVTNPAPLPRYWPNLVYDSAARTVVLAGGFWYTSSQPSQPSTADTWRFDFGSTTL